MRTFLLIWSGQMISILGSEITNFAITIWAWELTGQATSISLIFLFTNTPPVIASTFAGIIVDRFNRKYLMMLGDAIAGLSTLVILACYFSDNLSIWLLCITGAVNSFFGYIQNLAYSASLSSLVAKKHYSRAAAMGSIKGFSAFILAPALGGVLYYLVGLTGILTIDIATFLVAFTTLAISKVPQPPQQPNKDKSIKSQLTFGFRYIFKRPSLFAILIFLLVTNFLDNSIFGMAPAMMLARSGNNSAVYASIQTAFGVGGLVGAVVLSVWGGPKTRIHGLLAGNALAKMGLLILAFGQTPWIWCLGAFAGGLFIPVVLSSNQAIWLSKVNSDIQGRVFASRYLIAQVATPIGLAISGPLADHVFEPAMKTNSALARLLNGFVGEGPGAGMALQCILFASLGICFSLGCYLVRNLRQVEVLIPDAE